MADISDVVVSTDSTPTPSLRDRLTASVNTTASDVADNVSAEIGEEVEDAVMFGFFGIM